MYEFPQRADLFLRLVQSLDVYVFGSVENGLKIDAPMKLSSSFARRGRFPIASGDGSSGEGR